MNNVFELVQRTNEQVVIKVNADNNLVIAMHPYVDSNYDYITVTRGKNHTLTIVNKNGSTCSFDWGDRGRTLISDGLERLKKEVVKFIEEDCKIVLDADTDDFYEASIFYNSNFKKWQIKFNDRYNVFTNAKNVCEAMGLAEKYAVRNVDEWESTKAVTGITVFKASWR